MPLYVNADWSALVPEGSPEAAFGITPKDAQRRGLAPLAPGETLDEPETLASANLLSTATKEAPAPHDKAAKKPADKGAARKDTDDGDGR